MEPKELIYVCMERTIDINGEEYDASMQLTVSLPAHCETWHVEMEDFELSNDSDPIEDDKLLLQAHLIINQEIRPDGRFYEEALQKAFV